MFGRTEIELWPSSPKVGLEECKSSSPLRTHSMLLDSSAFLWEFAEEHLGHGICSSGFDVERDPSRVKSVFEWFANHTASFP